MTHQYIVLVGGTIITGLNGPDASSIAWAQDTVLAIGTDEEVLAISRGDSNIVDLRGATVMPIAAASEPRWPSEGTLQVGSGADLAILRADPRASSAPSPIDPIAVVRGGRVVAGALPAGSQRTVSGHAD